jgi:sulfatase maturation enzyme AslB (radical SAM superfamily)
MKTRLRDIPKSNYRINKAYESVMSFLNPYPENPPFGCLSLEITTRCNSICNFCAHNRIIGEGVRPNMDMSFEMAKKCIDWYSQIPKVEVTKFIPTGLGETLLHPRLMGIIAYAKEVWPNVETFANTNCINLSGNIAESVIDNGLDELTFSLCFVEKKDYEANLGTKNYDIVLKNIKEFLALKGDRPPRCKVHIFDREENRQNMRAFVKEFSPNLNKNDSLSVKQFVDLLSVSETPVDNWTCDSEEMSEFDSILIDVEGNVLPCCSALWKEDYRNLILAKVLIDSPGVLPVRTKAFRARPPNETCRHCVRIRTPKNAHKISLACPVRRVGR